MNAPVVLDASAAVRAVMDAGAQGELLDCIDSAPLVLAPMLLRVEAANALWKYRRAATIDVHQTLARHHQVLSLVQRYIDDATLYPEALQLAIEHDHPVYDALYAVTARRHAACVLTFDTRLQVLCKRAQVACRLFG